MWFALNALSRSDFNLAESIRDLFESTSRRLFLFLTGVSLCIYLFLAASYPDRFRWEALGLAVLLGGVCWFAVWWMPRQIVLSLVVFPLGFSAVVALAMVDYHQAQVGYLLALVPLLAVITIGWPAGIAAEAMIAVLPWLIGQATHTPPGFEAVGIPAAGMFAGLIGWIAVHSLLTVTEWSLYSYNRASENLKEARDQRVILLQTQEDLVLANRELARLSDRLKLANQVAEGARRAKEEFVANVSHELRTPLNMIIGFAETITQSPRLYGTRLPPALLADIAVIQRNSMHLSRLVDDVLDLSQVETGRMALTLERASIQEVIESAVTVVKPLYETKKLFLRVETAADLPEVLCDRTRIRQVVINLLSNSGRFTDNGGVAVRVIRDERGVTISVTDSGPGISPEDQKRLFEPFQQLDSTIRHKQGGSGLGLSISKRFVEMHGGKIWLESELGQGTTFFVHLPLEPVLDNDDPMHAVMRWINPQISYNPRTRPMRVSAARITPRYVVLEHGHTLYYLFRRYLSDAEVVAAANPQDAVEILGQTPAQALVINSQMTEGGAVQRLLAGPLPFDTPAIVCWMPWESNREQLGVVEYLIKPVNSAVLTQAVDRLGKDIRTILIVDDEPDLVRLFTRILTAENRSTRILTAANGQEALQYLADQPVDAIILDLIMPGMNGFDFLSIKAQDARIQSIPVIVVTSRDPGNQPITSNQITLTRSNGLTTNDLLACVQAICSVLTPIVRSDDPAP